MLLGRRWRFREESSEWICESRCHQVRVRLHVFAGVFGPWTPQRLQFNLCSVCILPQPAFYSQSAVCILHTVCIFPLVRSLQSAVCSLRFTLTVCSNQCCVWRSAAINLLWVPIISFNLLWRSVVPRGGNLTYNGDPRVGKLTFENLKMSNFPWVARPPNPRANHW